MGSSGLGPQAGRLGLGNFLQRGSLIKISLIKLLTSIHQ